jgi:hypothetical protein
MYKKLRCLCNLGIINAVLFFWVVNAFGGELSFTGGVGFAGSSRSTPWRISFDEKITSELGYRVSYINYWHFRHYRTRNNHIDGLAFQLTAGKEYGDISLNAGLGPFVFFNTINETKIRYGVDVASFLSADIKLHDGFFWRTEVNYAMGLSDGIRAFYVLTGPGYRLGQFSSQVQESETRELKDWVAVSATRSALNNLGTPKSTLGTSIEFGRELSDHLALALTWMSEGKINVKDGSVINRKGFIIEPRLFINVQDGEAGIGAGPYYETGRQEFNGIFTAFIIYPLGKKWDVRGAWDKVFDGNKGADVFRGGLGYRF